LLGLSSRRRWAIGSALSAGDGSRQITQLVRRAGSGWRVSRNVAGEETMTLCLKLGATCWLRATWLQLVRSTPIGAGSTHGCGGSAQAC